MLNIQLSPTEIIIIKRLCNYRKLMRLDNKKYSKILTPSLSIENGWLPHELIELPTSPYKENKRWDFLDKSLAQEKGIIEIDNFKYRDKRKIPRSEKIYRIKHSRDAEKAVLGAYADDIMSYYTSDYFSSQYSRVRKLGSYILDFVNLYCEFDPLNGVKPLYVIPESFINAYLNNDIISNKTSMGSSLGLFTIFDYLILFSQYDCLTTNDSNYQEVMLASFNSFSILKEIRIKQRTQVARKHDWSLLNKESEINKQHSILFYEEKTEVNSSKLGNSTQKINGPDDLIISEYYFSFFTPNNGRNDI